MKEPFVTINLGDLPEIDREKQKNDIIQARKAVNKVIKNSRTNSKSDKCYYCDVPCESFCNSHTVPAFCLRNIAAKGKVYYYNTIIDLPVLNEEKGVGEAGTFHLICRKCDSEVFKDYENPENYDNTPSIKMLAQIDMKNNLKSISKRLIESEMYSLIEDQFKAGNEWAQAKKDVSALDLREYQDAFKRAKKRNEKPFSGEYYIGFYEKLPYVVPIAFQGSVALVADLEGNIINNIYCLDSKYVIKNVGVCILPLKDSSIVMLFVDKENRRYSEFFRQLKKINDVEKCLSIINYILFAYTEDYFISPNIEQDVLDKLLMLSGKTLDMFSFMPTSNEEQMEYAKQRFNYSEREIIPNLLSKEYALNNISESN